MEREELLNALSDASMDPEVDMMGVRELQDLFGQAYYHLNELFKEVEYYKASINELREQINELHIAHLQQSNELDDSTLLNVKCKEFYKGSAMGLLRAKHVMEDLGMVELESDVELDERDM